MEEGDDSLKTFSTRPDTIYGVTFLAISPNHQLSINLSKTDENIKLFLEKCKDLKTAEADIAKAEKLGIDTGKKVIHPITKEKLPVWIGNFVLLDYGTGVVMGVPGHDERDFEFATKYQIDIKQVIKNDKDDLPIPDKGILINSDNFDGMTSEDASKEIINKYFLDDYIISLIYKDNNDLRVLSKIKLSDKIFLDNKVFKNFTNKNYPLSNYSVQGSFVYLWQPDSSRLYKWDTSTDQINTFYQSKNLSQTASQGFSVYNDTLIYIATYGFGLVELNTIENSKRYITVSNGIPSQHLYEVFTSDDKNLWVSSNYGIFSYNPISKAVKSFSVADGLQDYEFNSASSYHAKDGEMFFAGVRGLNYFYPKDIVPKSNPPEVVIQNALVGEKPIDLNSSVIKVPWYDNKIVFDFVALNFRNPIKNQYSYFMDGYEDDWIYSDNRRFATYTNLPAGEYTFKAKGSNNDGIWNEIGTSINVKVSPPPWQTWWAYLIYVFSVLGLGYSYSKYREKAQLKQMEDERKQSELDAAKDLQESMLPKTTPHNKEYSIETFIRSSTEVGGDYYDFFKQEDGSFYSVCGDATGHGTTAGMMVSITKAGLNGIPSLPPNEILNRLNKVVKKVDLGIIRMSLNIVHFKNGTATMANAAMPPIYHYSAKKKKMNEIEIVNLPLGGLSGEEYELVEINFEKDDLLVQLSDGLPEAPNPVGDLVDYERLYDCIEQNAMKSPKDVVESLVDLAEKWLDGNINPDDITIVATKKG